MRRAFHSSLGWDLTEVDRLDDLHRPRGALKKAQGLAAELFGSQKSFFLVNGVTGGMLALFSALCQPGDRVLLSRLSHKSAVHGIALSGALPRYIPVEREPHTGFPLNVSPDAVEGALREEAGARLVLITSPSYWGVTAPLDDIARITSRYGALLLVDEAHGGHLPFYPQRLPHSAGAGADLWLHSAHKSLGALTPGGMLHLGSRRHAAKLRHWLQVFQTSSPPYPLMISLDLARRGLALNGTELYRRCWEWALELRLRLEKEGCRLIGVREVAAAGFALDPCRLTMLFPAGEGVLAAKKLAGKSRIQVELEDSGYLLAIAGPALLSYSPCSLARRFGRSLREAGTRAWNKPEGCSAAGDGTSPGFFPPNFFEGASSFFLTPQDALRAPARAVNLESAAGLISAETVALSPPGIPLLTPGEIIAEETAAFLCKKREGGASFHGTADPALRRIRVLRGP